MISDVVTPLLQWLNTHPESAGLATFIISAAESIAIIGTIVPGSVTMTAIGALAGSGVIPFWSTILWAILGAIAGDNGSFWLGHHFKRRLPACWPFRNYPQLLDNGEIFFRKHGTASVFIGRFIGPVRALVPIVAGMLAMPSLRYIPVSIMASILWAPTYMLPGILLGAASLELPPDVAVHVLLVLLLVGLFIIICAWMIYKSFLLVGLQIDQGLNWVWEKLRRSHYFQFWTTVLKHHDVKETHGQLTLAFYFIVTCVLFAYFASFILLHPSQDITVNKVFFYAFRSFRTAAVDNIMLVITLFGDKRILAIATFAIFGWLVYQKRWRTAFHALALLILTCLSVVVFKHLIHSPRPWGIVANSETFSFPSGHTTFSTTFYLGLGLLLIESTKIKCRWPLYLLTGAILVIICTSRLYLGAHWFTDIVAGWILSAALLMFVVISYNRKAEKTIHPKGIFLVAILTIVLMVGLFSLKSFHQLKQDYALLDWPRSTITLSSWWDQKGENLPLYRIGRVGLPAEIFNLQWIGTLDEIESSLKEQGWVEPPQPTWGNVVLRVTDVSSAEHLPLVSPLYLDKKPVLVLEKHIDDNKKLVVLRLWSANVSIEGSSLPLWVGSVGTIPRTYSWLINYKRKNDVTVNTSLIFATIPQQYEIKPIETTLKLNHHWHQAEMILIKPKQLAL